MDLDFYLFFCHKPNPLPFLSIKVDTINFNLKLSSLYGLKKIKIDTQNLKLKRE